MVTTDDLTMTSEGKPHSPGGAITFSLPDDHCIRCGNTEGPLHPGEPEPMGPGVVRDTAVCTEHLEVARPVEHYWEEGRYQMALLPPNLRGVRLWGVLDHAQHGAWVEEVLDDEGTVGTLAFALRDSAEAWIGRVRHMTEGRARVNADQ